MVGPVDFRPRQPAEGNLSGLWRASPATLELKRTGADADLDDSGWQPLDVPGHWGQVPALANHDGPILHRKRFDHRPAEAEERLWLRFDGVLSGAEIWLDGHYVGDTTSYFAPRRFEVTDRLAESNEHLLAVEVACPEQGDSRNKSSLTGALQTGHLAPAGNPGGIWRDVAIDSTGPVAIKYARLLCTRANENQAEIVVRLVLDNSSPVDGRDGGSDRSDHEDRSDDDDADDATGGGAGREIRIDTSVVGPDGSSAGGGVERHQLASGENRIEWSVTIDNPELWWPAALGAQPLYEVAIAVRLPDGQLSDRRDWRTGLREVRVDNFIWRVNGQRLFAKGIAYGPTDRFLNNTSVAALAKDVASVRDAGLDLLRVYGHIARSELYDEADRQGVLIWQDLPLVGGYSSKVRSAARSMTRAAVDHLGHHPSVGLWCGHCEPNGPAFPEPPTRRGVATDTPSAATRRPPATDSRRNALGNRFGRHLLPSWNRSILDPIIGRELRNADSTRPIVARSGSMPSPGDLTGSDANLWLGWHAGRPEDLGRILQRWPRLGAFLGGIGSQSAALEDWNEAAPTWSGAERGAFARYIPRRAYRTGRDWAEASRAYQADLLRVHIETTRRLKYRPAGGFCVTSLTDADRGGGFGVFDYNRRPKPAHNVLIDACRPVIVVAEAPPSLIVPDQPISLPVHVISDLRKPLGSVRVTATAHEEGRDPSDRDDGAWNKRVVWEGELPADCCQWIGDLVFEAPQGPGAVSIDLALESSELLATNRYRTVVIPPSEAIGHSRRPGVR